MDYKEIKRRTKMNTKLIWIYLLSLLLVSCQSKETITEEQKDYTSYFERQEQQIDSMFASLQVQQQKTTEKLSNLKVEHTTTYYSLPDSTGKQYPVYISTTTANKDDKVNEHTFTKLNAEISKMQEKIDSLTNAINATLQQKESMNELSWWDLNKSKVIVVIVIVIISGIVILYRKIV